MKLRLKPRAEAAFIVSSEPGTGARRVRFSSPLLRSLSAGSHTDHTRAGLLVFSQWRRSIGDRLDLRTSVNRRRFNLLVVSCREAGGLSSAAGFNHLCLEKRSWCCGSLTLTEEESPSRSLITHFFFLISQLMLVSLTGTVGVWTYHWWARFSCIFNFCVLLVTLRCAWCPRSFVWNWSFSSGLSWFSPGPYRPQEHNAGVCVGIRVRPGGSGGLELSHYLLFHLQDDQLQEHSLPAGGGQYWQRRGSR